MARETSVEAYRTAMESGHIGKRQKQVYDILYNNGPLTANETYNILAEQMGGALRFDSNTRARFTELRTMGLIREVSKVKDPITNMNVIQWDVTAKVPEKMAKQLSIKTRLALAELVLSENDLTHVYQQLISEK